MSVADIGDDEDKEDDYFKSCSTAELNGMYLNSARQGDWPRIERLLAAGAELNYAGGAALTAAIDGNYIDVAKKLLALGLTPTQHVRQEALGDAVFAGNVAGAAFMIDEGGADPKHSDSACLFSAIVNNKPDMVRLLVKKGADVAANKKTLLCIALSHTSEKAAQALIEAGADPRWTLQDMNAYEWAAKRDMPKILQLLHEASKTDVYMSPGFFRRQTIAELRGLYDERQRVCGITLAAQACCFDIVRDKFLASATEKLQPEDLTKKEPGGKDALKLLAERGELGLAFDPRLWIGRKEEALALLDGKVAPEYREQVKPESFAAELDRVALKSRAKAASLKLKPRK